MRVNLRTRAFSLLEALVVVALLTILVGLSVTGFQRGSEMGNVRAVSESLAATLLAARDQARSLNSPVAVVFPSSNGTTAASRGYYLLEGNEKPRVVERRLLGQAEHGIYYFLGDVPSSLTRTLTAPQLQTGGGLDLSHWQAPFPKDYHIIFAPSGRVYTNGLPLCAGRYRLVVAQGLTESPASAYWGVPAVPWIASCFSLNRVGPCQTVLVDPLGKVYCEAGLTDSTLSPGQTSPGEPLVPAVPPRDGVATSAPTLTEVSIAPDPSSVSLPPGCDALIPVDRHVEISAWATSPQGFPLHCQWSGNGGVWSSAQGHRMAWDSNKRAWKSTWCWAPSPGTEGQTFQLNCRIYDEYGHDAPASALAQVDFQVSADPFLVGFSSNRGGALQAFTMRSNGSGVNRIRCMGRPVSECLPSPDGSKVVMTCDLGAGNTELFLANRDGTGLRRLTFNSDGDWAATFSPDGSEILYHSMRGGKVKVYLLRLTDGAASVDIAPSFSETWYGVFSDDGTRALFQTPDTGNGDCYVLSLHPLTPPLSVSLSGPTASWESWPRFQQGSNRFVLLASDLTGSPELWGVDTGYLASGPISAPVQMTSTGGCSHGRWMADGRLYYLDASQNLYLKGTATPIMANCGGAVYLRDGSIICNVGAAGSREIIKIYPDGHQENLTQNPADDYIKGAGDLTL